MTQVQGKRKFFPECISKLLCSRSGRTILCVFLLQFLVSFAKHIVEVPAISLFETAICKRYARAQGQPWRPEKCKVPAVQNELSRLTGWKFFFDNLPGLLAAIYFGSLSDKWGRKPILILFCVGTMLSYAWIVVVCVYNDAFPPRLVWASSAFILFGSGGQRVFKAMQFTIIADTFRQPRRTRLMYLLASIPHISTLTAPPFGQIFIVVGSWIAFVVAIACLILGTFIVWVMPESSSRKLQDRSNLTDGVASPELASLLHHENANLPAAVVSDGDLSSKTLSRKRSVLLDLRHLLSTPILPFCFAIFLLRPFALISRAFVYQHASETFHWPISKTVWLRVAQAVGSSVVTLLILPAISLYLGYRQLHGTIQGGEDVGITTPESPTTRDVRKSKNRDLNTVRVSLFVAALGFTTLWLAIASWELIAGLIVCGLSEGLEPGLQALATTLVDKSYNARLLTFVAVLEISGKLAGGPVMGTLFSIGRGDGHGSSGVSFALSAGLFALMGMGSWAVRLED